jgi:hypothetical protein
VADLLDKIDIASPCNMSWDAMTGDSRVRFCGKCEQNVYRLSDLPRVEAMDLLHRAQSGENLCVRFARRADGTVVTNDCPSGVRTRREKRWAQVRALAASLVGIVGASMSTGCYEAEAQPADPPAGSSSTPAEAQPAEPAPETPATPETPSICSEQKLPEAVQQVPAEVQLPQLMGRMVAPAPQAPVLKNVPTEKQAPQAEPLEIMGDMVCPPEEERLENRQEKGLKKGRRLPQAGGQR